MSKTHKITQLKKRITKLEKELELASENRHPDIDDPIIDIPLVKPKYTPDDMRRMCAKFGDYLNRQENL